MNYEIFINEFQTVLEFQFLVVSLLMDGGVGLVQYHLRIWFALVQVCNSKKRLKWEANNVGVVYNEWMGIV